MNYKIVLILALSLFLLVACTPQPQVEFKLGDVLLFTEADVLKVDVPPATRTCLQKLDCDFSFDVFMTDEAKAKLMEAAQQSEAIEGKLADKFEIIFKGKEFDSFFLPAEAQKYTMESININGRVVGISAKNTLKLLDVLEKK